MFRKILARRMLARKIMFRKMLPRTTLPLFVALFLLLLTPVSASASKIKTGADPDFDFSTLRTYAWRPLKAADSQVGPSIRRAADEVLKKKGLRKVGPDDDPDVWFDFMVGQADMLRADWRFTIGWWGDIWAVPGMRSRVEAGVLIAAIANGRGDSDDTPVWGGQSIMVGNNPDALMVMASMVGKETKKLVKRYPGLK